MSALRFGWCALLLVAACLALISSVSCDDTAAAGVSPVSGDLATEEVIGDEEEEEIEYEDHPRVLLHQIGTHLKVDEVESLSTKAFFDDYVAKKRPLLIRKGFADAPAFTAWSDEYLAELAASHSNFTVAVDRKAKENREEELVGVRFSSVGVVGLARGADRRREAAITRGSVWFAHPGGPFRPLCR